MSAINIETSKMPRNSKLAIASAKQINEQHLLAKQHASTAIEHAILCGQMLADKKDQLGRGGFDDWVNKNCEFSRATAYNYIKVSKLPLPAAIEMSAIRHLFPSGKATEPSSEINESSRALDDSTKTAAEKAPFLTPKDLIPDTQKSPVSVVDLASEPACDLEPERPEWDEKEDAALEAVSMELIASAEKALGTDAMTEIRRLTAELSAVKLSRDGYMDGKAEITRLLQAEQRKTDRLNKRIAELDKENQQLRARLAIMEAA